jgi:hypothetical protein
LLAAEIEKQLDHALLSASDALLSRLAATPESPARAGGATVTPAAVK